MWKPTLELDPKAGLEQLLEAITAALPEAFDSADVPALPVSTELQHYLAGVVTFADWLGSNAAVFHLTGDADAPVARFERSRQLAEKLLKEMAFDGLDTRTALFSQPATSGFAPLFGFEPRALQAAMGTLDVFDSRTRTLVAESDTGSGKSEAALYWWTRLRAAGVCEGLYFALPTRVAARELYKRVRSFIERAYPDPAQRPQVLLAVPGYAQINGAPPTALPAEDVLYQDDERIAAIARTWAAEQSKRFLAAPIVVGTIDQALASMLKRTHAHMRSSLLDRHLLVVDEVHSSDAYMRALLKDLLKHRRSRGLPSLLLSATLGAEARQELLGQKRPSMPYAEARSGPYPLVSGTAGLSIAVPATSDQKKVSVQPLPLLTNLSAVAERVVSAAKTGARVLVVLNTVSRAVELQQQVEHLVGSEFIGLFRVGDVACPHHGRFAASDREVMDAQVQTFLGKGSGPGPKILIGTQTLEQSLDIDADLLITDLCPMDVLLQRVGRLWRHARPQRPPSLSANGIAQCWLLTPEDSLERALGPKTAWSGEVRAAGLGSVYADMRMLELTMRYFQENTSVVSIPADNRKLVEAVVHSTPLTSLRSAAWTKHTMELSGATLGARQTAGVASCLATRAISFGEEACRFDALLDPKTRIGDGSWTVALDSPVPSPFSSKARALLLRELQIPARFVELKATAPDFLQKVQEPAVITKAAEGVIRFRWAETDFEYSRSGLARR